jgi:4-amino-4-deoxy-L-arabinose transferase-like glycosyltransferase
LIEGDEAWTGLAALKLLSADAAVYTHPFSFFEGFGRIHLRLFRLAIYIFGQNTFGLRLVPAIGGTLAIPATYLFARRLMGAQGALVAAALLAVSHAHMHFSRTSAVGYIQSTWFSPLELYFFLSGLEQRSRARLVLAGLLVGLQFNFYYSAQINLGFLVVYLLVAFFLARPLLRGNLLNLAWFFGMALLVALPSLLWLFRHPNLFLFSARWLNEGTFQSGWLDHRAACCRHFMGTLPACLPGYFCVAVRRFLLGASSRLGFRHRHPLSYRSAVGVMEYA